MRRRRFNDFAEPPQPLNRRCARLGMGIERRNVGMAGGAPDAPQQTHGAAGLAAAPRLWCPWSERYRDWRQLEELGLVSKGGWA